MSTQATKELTASKPRPTVSELQSILDSGEDRAIVVQPDGSILAVPDNDQTKTLEAPVASPLPEVPPPAPPSPPVVAAAAPAAPNYVYFQKTQVSMPFFVNKKPVPFEVLGGNIGVIRLDPAKDGETIAALDTAAEAHRGGILVITEQDRDELKKNQPYSPSATKSQPTVRVWETQPRRLPPRESGSVAVANPSPVGVASHGSAPAVVGGAEGAGKPPTAPTSFSPNLQRKSEGKGPVLRQPSTGQFRPEVPVV